MVVTNMYEHSLIPSLVICEWVVVDNYSAEENEIYATTVTKATLSVRARDTVALQSFVKEPAMCSCFLWELFLRPKSS